MKARIVMMIHDAVWVEAPEEEANEVRHLVRRVMTTAPKLGVPWDVDLSLDYLAAKQRNVCSSDQPLIWCRKSR